MAFSLTQWAYAQNVRKIAEKSVLMFLCFHSQPDGYSWHSYKMIAAYLATSESTVKRSVHALVNSGLLTVNTRLQPHGGKTSNLIRARPDQFLKPEDSKYIIRRINPCVVCDYDGRPKIAFNLDRATYQYLFPGVHIWKSAEKNPIDKSTGFYKSGHRFRLTTSDDGLK